MDLVLRDNRGLFLDFNGDGEPDIAAVDFMNNTLTVYLGIDVGGFQPQVQTDYRLRTAQSIMAGDLNSDGQTDLIWANKGSNTLTIVLSAANGTFPLNQPHFLDVGNVHGRQPEGFVLADFNDDGGIDIAVANSGTDDISILLKNLVIG